MLEEVFQYIANFTLRKLGETLCFQINHILVATLCCYVVLQKRSVFSVREIRLVGEALSQVLGSWLAM